METSSAPTPAAAARPTRKSSGVVIPHAPKWHQRILAALIFALARGMAATLRFKLNDESGRRRSFSQSGTTAWHWR
jgi:hypothetical protein